MNSCDIKKRRSSAFGKSRAQFNKTDLIGFQLLSYNKFLYGEKKLEIYEKDDLNVNSGLMNVIRSIFPVVDRSNTFAIDIISITIHNPTLSIEECLDKDETYSVKIKVKVRLIIWSDETEDSAREIISIKEQVVYLCDIPLITNNANFIINGCDYVVVSQVHRSPGLLLESTNFVNSGSFDKILYSAHIIPYRGSWLDFEFDVKDLIFCRIDKKRKFPLTTFLRILKYDSQQILQSFYEILNFQSKDHQWYINFDCQLLLNHKLTFNICDESLKVLIKEGTIITQDHLEKIKDITCVARFSDNLHAYCADDVFDKNGELLYEVGSRLALTEIEDLRDLTENLSILLIDNYKSFGYIVNTLNADGNDTYEDALSTFYKIIRPGEMVSVPVAEFMLQTLFFNKSRYDLADVGRLKINEKLGFDDSVDSRILRIEDIIAIIKALIDLRNGVRAVDDVDDLSNRRVRTVGELVENQFRSGVLKLTRAILDRVSANMEVESIMPFDLFNTKSINTVLKEFFASSQLSQFMDHTNPLAEVTHKRRITALGPGGLVRERAGFEVRDVHFTHYGRICTAETPDSSAVGLVNNLAIFAHINKYGFIEVPYYKVIDGVVTNEVVFLNSFQEKNRSFAQSNIAVDKDGKIVDDFVYCRKDDIFYMAKTHEVDYVDVDSCQIVSITASLIPFLENNDVSRALMGANMQRQAVPLVNSEAPWVGTGMESLVIKDSGEIIFSKIDGIVTFVDSKKIIITSTDESEDLQIVSHDLRKYAKSNAGTCINFVPRVYVDQKVKKGDLIADGFGSDEGELALGKNLLTAIIPWEGLNFEDSVIISEKVSDKFSSNHIEELECIACDTRLGAEEITRDIPYLGEEFIRHLDESGIVLTGTKVKTGDILVGKITPVNEVPITAEEKLLRMVFGEKTNDVKDSSLYVPSGVHGTVVNVSIRFVKGLHKDDHLLLKERSRINELVNNKNTKILHLNKALLQMFKKFVNDSKVIDGEEYLRLLDTKHENIEKIPVNNLFKIKFEDENINEKIKKICNQYKEYHHNFEAELKTKASNVIMGDDLGNGVIKIVKIFIAMNHCLQPGDKVAGRHGNKGVISRVLPVADMPHLEDGTPIDIIINPLGVPSRMNIGQIRENHMGWFCYKCTEYFRALLLKFKSFDDQQEKQEVVSEMVRVLQILYPDNDNSEDCIDFNNQEHIIAFVTKIVNKGFSVIVPVFQSPSVEKVEEVAKQIGIDIEDRVNLYDAITGEKFHRKVTVGFMYFKKLHHMAHFKMHARSVGPYSLVTQQPLGGRSHFGGQRLGEMEVWALEAHGAAYNILEMLTVKSDDVVGRLQIYESIVRGENTLKPFMSEALKVFKAEIASLGLDLRFYNYDDEEFINYCKSKKIKDVKDEKGASDDISLLDENITF